MTWLNWSLKFHSRLRIIPHLIHTHTTHMPNVQWMSYSFVRLYLSKCDICMLNHIWINLKRFLIILYVFGSDFYHSLCSCLVFSLFKHVSVFEKQVSEFFATHFGYLREQPVLTTRFDNLQAASSYRGVSRLTCNSARNSPVTKHPESAF